MVIKKIFFILEVGVFFISGSLFCYGKQTIVAQKVDEPPVIDGEPSDAVWDEAEAIVTHDKVADIDITLKAVWTDKEIFFLVSFPDADESRTHKSWVWDKEMEIYKMGPDREDVFVFKWNMEEQPVDLSIYADNPYRADIWFWKANRTDPRGFADDKMHILSPFYMEDAAKLTSKSGKTMYLLRKGDEGKSVYKTDLPPPEYETDAIPRFSFRTPTGSRADVRAKGVWREGRWTIEFGRALTTGNGDDIPFDTTKSYWFGVSRYEIGARKPNPDILQPLYGSGDVGEELRLVFGKGD
jgi:hypothetical protein